MQNSPQSRSGAAGRRLLLVLALAACGGGDSPDAQAEQSSAQLAKGDGAACTAPSPAVDPALLNDTVSWDSLTAWRVAAGVSFVDSNPDSTIARVRLCATCSPITLRIVSEAKTYCNTPASLNDTTRIAGVWVVVQDTVTPPGWGHTFTRGDSILVFARDTASPARLAYNVGGNVHMAPADAWRFQYCSDGHSNNRPMGKWRNRRTGRIVTLADTGDLGSTGDPPGTYGWMACASGCCQFYIPPVIELPGRGKGKGLESVPPGSGPGAGGRPVCARG